MNDWGFLTGTKKKNTLQSPTIVGLIKCLWKGPNIQLWIPLSLQVSLQVNISCQNWSCLSWCSSLLLVAQSTPKEALLGRRCFVWAGTGESTQVNTTPKWPSVVQRSSSSWHETSQRHQLILPTKVEKGLISRREWICSIGLSRECRDLAFCHSGFYASHRGGSWSWRRKENFFPLLNWE